MRLLFCEDEYLTRLGVVQTLKWADMGIDELDTARNGQEGMEKLALLPDILLTDIRMPFISGLEIAEALKKQNPDSEVIIMSSYSDKEYLKKAIVLSTVAYIEKPLDLAELRRALENAVARRKQSILLKTLQDSRKPVFSCLPDPETPGFSHATRLVLREIQEHYANLNLSVDSLAQTVHFSPVYLGTTFREETGRNIRPLLTEVRIEAACRLLETTNLPILQIALQTGFSSPNYFAKQFRRNTGISPNEYRERRDRAKGDPHD